MLENMQRSSSLFQSKATKSESKASEKGKAQQHQQPNESQDQMDFSSEFSNQDKGLGQDKGSDVLEGWEDLIEDDDWLTDDEDDEGDDGDEGEDSGGYYESEEEGEQESTIPPPQTSWQPMKRPGFLPRPSTSNPTQSSSRSTEKKLGFQWGPVEEKKESAKETQTPEPTIPKAPIAPAESAEPEPVAKGQEAIPFSATRRGGWKSFPKEEKVASPRVRPLGGVMLPARGQLQKVESKIVSAAQLLVATPEGEPGYEECIRLLDRFGLGAIRLCTKAKVQIHILDEKDFTTHPELLKLGLDPEEYPVDGAYLVESRSCLIDRRCLTEKPQFFHPALYYIAHALDHAQGGEDFSSRKAAAVLACFEASCSGLHGADFVDELAAADPVRYFARSVAIYLGRDDCTDAIWNHEDLKEFDRSMHDYLSYLFARFAV